MESAALFDYVNLTGRRPGKFVTLAGTLSRGVARVQAQVAPYAAAWRAANLQALQGSGPRWVVLGDSMSQGIGASAFDAGWVNQVHARLASDGLSYRLINLAANGSRIADVIDRQLPAWRCLPERDDSSADSIPDLVTVLIGSNDLIRKRYREGAGQRMAELLTQLPSGAVVATMPNPTRAANAMNDAIERAAARGGIVIADTRGGRPQSWQGRLSADHFHPNDLGYAGIADNFYRAIASARTVSPG